MNAKKELRIRFRRKRLEVPNAVSAEWSLLAQNNLIESSIWRKAKRIGLYASTPEEISTDMLIEKTIATRGAVWLPRISDGRAGQMYFTSCRTAADLQPGRFGIREPSVQDAGECPIFYPDLLLIPGLAFDMSGNRLGYGGGFYDRLLPHYPDCLLVGFCYYFQIVESLPHDEWDIPVRYLCTEKGLVCL